MRYYVVEAGLGELVKVDSAGTTGFHAGDAPDRRSVAVAKKHGVGIDEQRARQVTAKDFHDFDLILALDKTHLQHLLRMKPAGAKAEVVLFLEYAGVAHMSEVPDPYYGDVRDFEYVLDLIVSGVKPIIDKLQQLKR